MHSKILETKNYYDGISSGYKELYHSEQIEKISLIEEFLPRKKIILDAGSGDGILNNFLEHSTIISLDLSFELLKLNSNKNKINGNLLELPLQKNSIDCICSFTVIQDTPDVKKVIEEFYRVLKHGEILIISFLKISSKRQNIEKNLKNLFKIEKELEEIKDKIMVCKKE